MVRERHESGSELRGRWRIPGRSWAEGKSGVGTALPRVERVRICHDKRAKTFMQAMAKAGVLLLVRWLGLIIA